MEVKNEKKVLILSAIAVVTLIIVVVGATYAFFTAQGGGSANTNVNVQTNTTDNLSFEVGEAISITANQQNFGQGMGNQAGSTTASATLTANNATNTATRNYYLYLNITNNDFTYTTVEETAELILTITDPDGTELQTLDGYNHVTVGEVTGFDITEANGLITIADDYEISATDTPTTQEWNVTVTFVNLDSDQEENTNKTFEATLIIQEDKIPTTLAEICAVDSNSQLLSCQVYTQYNEVDGTNGIYYHDADLANGAQDNSYRYAGANPNNYVCFGSDAASCSADNLYRIIGVFGNQVKLIKNTSIGTNLWSGSNINTSNKWSRSTLNIDVLNGTYLTTLGSEWTDKIVTMEWKVGRNTYQNIIDANAPIVYQNEIVNPSGSETYIAKIGLMYVSDYMYGAAPTYWTYKGYDTASTDYRAAINDNWMYSGIAEWTISSDSDNTSSAFYVVSTGDVDNDLVFRYGFDVRPSFYLASTVEISSGTGTSTDPFVLNLG